MRVRSTSSGLVCALSALLLAGAAGCVPTLYNTRPAVTGSVRDTSGAPIPGAIVRVAKPDAVEGRGGAAAKTDEQGRFKVPPARKLGVYWLTQKPREWTWKVQAEAPGHTPAAVKLTDRGKRPRNTFENLKFRLPAQ